MRALLRSHREKLDNEMIGRAASGQLDYLKLSLDMGARVNAKNHMGDTALILAARHDSAGSIHMLLQAGADPDITDDLGYSALETARRRGNQAAALALERFLLARSLERELPPGASSPTPRL